MRGARLAIAALVVSGVAASAACAQKVEPETRIDAIIAHRSAVQAALGADIPFSPDLHLELAVGGGPALGGGGRAKFGGRVDAVVHFLLDPAHAMRWSTYAGGGVGGRYDTSARWRAVTIVVVGVNAPRRKHMIPFLEAGFGGGVRIGAGVRRF